MQNALLEQQICYDIGIIAVELKEISKQLQIANAIKIVDKFQGIEADFNGVVTQARKIIEEGL